MKIVCKLKEIRMREFMMNMTEFAKFLDVNVKTYSRWEKGNGLPPLDKALQIAQKLKRNVNDIWHLTE